ncbi:MAG: hypothetical protein JO340_18710 [Acidobacteriaceae bacterium]|nr:hypothetical protein [Acidobacteriaceae bacterium]
MEREEQSPVAVYDFLYRDQSRLDSYYAQIFGGRRLSLEKTSATKKQHQWNAKLNTGLLSVERQAPTEISEGLKEVIDPQDTATIDVLQWLAENEYIANSVADAKQGQFIRLHGNLLLVDRRLMVAAAKAITVQSGGNKSTREMKMGAELFAQYPMPSMFTLNSADETLYAGTLTDAGIESVMSSHTWKFGPDTMDDVHVIAILESTKSLEDTKTSTLAPVLNLARTLHAWFPPSAVRVTPIVMYRRLISLSEREILNAQDAFAATT